MPEGYAGGIWVVSAIIQVFGFVGGHTDIRTTDYGLRTTTAEHIIV